MDIYIPENVEKIIDKLEGSGFEAYIVGGCVRDSILGKEPKDYDITTSALPEQVKTCLDGYSVIDTGIKHGADGQAYPGIHGIEDLRHKGQQQAGGQPADGPVQGDPSQGKAQVRADGAEEHAHAVLDQAQAAALQ